MLNWNRYGTYQQEPEEPVVGSPNYPATIYGSWDPNWRSFVGTTFIVALEEFEYLMSEETASLILESVKNSTIGDYYRVGGVDGDNFYPSYSNPVSPAFTFRELLWVLNIFQGYHVCVSSRLGRSSSQ